MSFDTDAFHAYLALLEARGFRPATVPAIPGTKQAAVKWKEHAAGTHGPHFRHTEGRLLLTGARSSGICIVDIDLKAGGLENFERYEEERGRAERVLTVRSPTGGLHLYFRPPYPWRTVTDRPVPGVDLRGEGGVVMTPGSQHPRGGHYRIEI